VDAEGRLEVTTPAGKFQDDKPVAYQEKEGKKSDVSLAFALGKQGNNEPDRDESLASTGFDGSSGNPAAKAHEYGFEIGAYDRTRPLIIDPAVLIYCGYIGGSSYDEGRSIGVDSLGQIYVTGTTQSDESTYPVKLGPDLAYNGGSYDAFVAKVNAAGTGLIYCGYIGGSSDDFGNDITVDSSGNAYITGDTCSDQSSFPIALGPGLAFNGGWQDAFVAKVNAAGTGLIYCGYIGGAGYDYGDGIAVDSSGNGYITGNTESDESSFPIMVGPDLTFNGGWADAFVAKVNAAGTGLIFCGYIGGSDDDFGLDIAVANTSDTYISGYAVSNESSFPIMVGPDLTFNGGWDAFVAKVNAAGTELIYCGYIGGDHLEYGYGIAVDNLGNAYVSGETYSEENSFPVAVGPDLTSNGSSDAFVAKVNASGTGLIYCGYIGGSSSEDSQGIVVDGSGSAYITGYTDSDESSFPVLVGPYLTYSATGDAFVAKIDSAGTALIYCGYIGGAAYDFGLGIAIDSLGNTFITGKTESDENSFPIIGGPDPTFNWADDAFIAKISYQVGFTGASKNISKSPTMSSRYPKVVTDQVTDSVFAIWVETSGDYDALYFSKSTNGGKTWTTPLALSNLDGQILGRVNDLVDNYAISLDVENPYIHVVMQKRTSVSDDFEIFYKRSTNLGGSWGAWVQLTVNTAESMRPDVAARSGYVHITYQDNWPGQNEIMYKRILNNGGGAIDQTRRLTFASGESCFPRVAVSEDGSAVHIVYQDNGTGQHQVFYKRITTSGSGAYTSRQLTFGVFYSGLPDITTSTGQDDQYVYIIYQALWPGNREIMYKRLGNYGNIGGSVYTARLTYSTTESRSGAIFFDPCSNSVNVAYHDNWSGNYDVMYRNLANYGGAGFTGKRVSWGTGDSSHATLSGSSGLIYVIWSDNTSGNYEVLLKKSN
jgi:hypothetical protein